MEENKYKYDLASAVAGAGFGAVVVGAVVAAGAVVVVGGAVAGGAVAGDAVVGPRNIVIGGIASLTLYSAMVLASGIGYNRGIETKLVPFSVEQDQGIVIQRGDDSQIPYVLKDGAYVLFEDLSRKDLSSKIEEGQKTTTGLNLDYQSRIWAILESVKDKQK